MKELSLHILDIAGNSVSAGAVLIEISVVDKPPELIITIRDNGCGMDADFLKSVTDPFTTTRATRKVGMGLPLFRMAAEQAGGGLDIESVKGAGTTVIARFGHGHIDTPPLGDMAGTVVTLVQGSPDIDFVYTYEGANGGFSMDTREMRELLSGVSLCEPEVLVFIREYIEQNEKDTNTG